MIVPLAAAALALYLTASTVQWRVLARKSGELAHAPAVLALAGCGLHGAALLVSWREAGGVDVHFFAALSLVALTTAILTAGLSLARPVGALGVVVYPVTAMALMLYPFGATSMPTRAVLEWQIQLHAGLSLLAYAALSLAALLAIMLWWLERALRQRRLGAWIGVFPPLTLVEELMFKLILAGFTLLTLSLLSGAVFVENLFAQHLVHKTVLSLLAWAVFGALLYGRVRHGWRGRRAVRWTLSAMLLLALAFFGSKFVLELVLARST